MYTKIGNHPKPQPEKEQVSEPKSNANDKKNMRCKCDQSKRYAVDMNGITFKVAFDAA